jgi:hypothetical protein
LKRILAIFKDLQDSGQPAAIIGHFRIQTGNFQEVANIDNVHEQPETALSETDAGKNANRYTTEHNQDDVSARHSVSISLELTPDLLEVIDRWQNLPDSMKTGLRAMIGSVLNS